MRRDYGTNECGMGNAECGIGIGMNSDFLLRLIPHSAFVCSVISPHSTTTISVCKRNTTMNLRALFRITTLSLSMILFPAIIFAQGTMADYERANGLRNKLQGLSVNVPEAANWIDKTSRFWYRKSVKGGSEFVLVDAETLAKKPAFDHEKLAASLSAATNGKYTAVTLP